MTAVLVIGAAVLGLLVGSFLNVVIWRVPRGESIVSPPSACPGCGHRVRARDNIPVVSWLLLHGRCRDCDMPIAARYPLVELATGLLFAGVAALVGLSPELPALWYFAAVGIALAAIDLDTKRLPNAITLPSYLVGGVLLAIPAAVDGRWDDYLNAWLGALALFAFYFALAWVYPAGMGFGDVKLAGVIGLFLGWFGWGPLIVGAFLGFALGALVGAGMLLSRRVQLRSAIPFGPFMLGGALLALLVGQSVSQWYTTSLW